MMALLTGRGGSILCLIQTLASAQVQLYVFPGDSANDRFGWSVSGAGDVNGDGFDDVIVGAPEADNNGFRSGMARVFSGVDGTVLYSFDGSTTETLFGFAVSGAGDVDGDGSDDFIVGATKELYGGVPNGCARVYSGASGAVIHTFHEFAAGEYGSAVSDAGDVNGDGHADVIVGSPWHDSSGIDSGSAFVYSGADGSVLFRLDGDSAGDEFGTSVSGAGDANGDGVPDFLVGAPFDDVGASNTGSAWVFSGADGSLLHFIAGSAFFGRLGTSVDFAGDLDGDGRSEVLVGAPHEDGGSGISGVARVYSGADGSLVCTLNGTPGDLLGQSVSSTGDVNGDGRADFIVGAFAADEAGQNSGSAYVLSSAGCQPLFALHGESLNGLFGFSVSDAGDVNGDGLADFVVGNSRDAITGPASGSARVFLGQPPPPPIASFCFGDGTGTSCPCSNHGAPGAGCQNSAAAGGARLTGSGAPSLTNDSVQLDVVGAPPHQVGLLLRGASPVNQGLGAHFGGGLLCLTDQVIASQPQVTSASGSSTFTNFRGHRFGATSLGAGETTLYQFIYREGEVSCAEFNSSNGLMVSWSQ